MEAQTVFDTKPLLRPAAVEEAKSEIKVLESQLQSPHIEDKGEVYRKLSRIKKNFDDQAPRAPESSDEEGRMASREKLLLSKILRGMPSQEEMRKAPPGAVDKHMAWERRNKLAILEWKNLRLRLMPGEREAPNLERYRPTSSSLSMDNAYIPGKQFYMPPPGAGLPVTFNDEQIAALRILSPQLADALAIMSREQRQDVKDALSGGIGLDAEVPDDSLERVERMSEAELHGYAGVDLNPHIEKSRAKKKKRGRRKARAPLTAEQKALLIQRLTKAREARAEKKRAAAAEGQP